MPAINAIEVLSVNTEINIPVAEGEVDNLASEFINNNKKGTTVMFHFLKEFGSGDDKYVGRILTNDMLDADELADYFKSIVSKSPVNGIFALDTGSYVPRLIMERAVNRGIKFRLVILSNKDLDKLANLENFKNKFNFAWANASYSFFIRFDGVSEWGLKVLGITLKFSKKAPKRANEVVRFAEKTMYDMDGENFLFTRVEDLPLLIDEGVDKWVIAEFMTPEGQSDMLYDGINFCTREFARRLGVPDYEDRENVRITFRRGVIKGDLIIVSDPRQLGGADFVYHTENLKGDIFTDGFVLVTAEKHDPFHAAGYDIQSTLNNPMVFHAGAMAYDLNKMGVEARQIIETGTIPKWMELSTVSKEDAFSGVQKDNLLTTAKDQRAMHVRWQEAGYNIQDGQNLMHMGLISTAQMMKRGWMESVKKFKKTFIPMTNATVASVVTYEAMVNMGGYTLHETDKMFFMKHVGAVIPGKRFVDTFDLHGTWDLDDTAKFRLVKLYSTNKDHKAALVKAGVLPKGLRLSSKADKAKAAIVIVRSPNGPGEYSVEMLDDNTFMPFDIEEANVLSLDVASLPLGQNDMLDMVTKKGLPADTLAYADEFTADHAYIMLDAQKSNPGIGRLANAMMCWVDVMGPSFPPRMTDVFGEMVDAVQQGFSKDQLEAVKKESTSVYMQLIDAMKANPALTLDADLAMTRMPSKLRSRVPQDQILGGSNSRISHFNGLYLSLYNDLIALAKVTTQRLRNNGELAAYIRTIAVGEEIRVWADNFYGTMTEMLQQVDREFRVDNYIDTPFTKLMKQHNKSKALRNVVDWAMDQVKSKDDDRYVIALYKICLPFKDRNSSKYGGAEGRFDRILFQTGTNGALADMLIAALERSYSA